ncbi:kinase-like protein [Martensiomyces pterosporus]|nr:kinase-like protein [Martensiomyces pterosporus]
MATHSQPLRVHDYTVLATLGISTLYNNIGMRLEEGREQPAGETQEPVLLNATYGSPPVLQQNKQQRRPYGTKGISLSDGQQLAVGNVAGERAAHKRKGAFSSANASNGRAGTTASSRLQSPTGSSRGNAASSSARGSAPKRARPSHTNGSVDVNGEALRLKSAFARVRPSSSYTGGDTNSDVGDVGSLGGRRRVRMGGLSEIGSSMPGTVNLRPMEYGEVWFNRYMILSKLGEGAFSQAFLAADLFCNRMGKRHEGVRLVSIKRMGAKEGVIGISDYQTISMLNRLDPKNRVPIVRIYDVFLHRPHQLRSNFGRFGVASYRDSNRSSSRHRAGSGGPRVFGDRADTGTAKTPLASDSFASSVRTVADTSDEHVCLVMEPLLGGTLHDAFPKRIKALYAAQDEAVAKLMHVDMVRSVIRQLLTAVAHMHSNSLIHADIKTTNVICVDDSTMRVKLIDFGNAVSDGSVSEYYSTFEIQTVWFRAPEVAYMRPFGRAIDIWSIGCVMCELWLGRSLFTDMDNRSLIQSILRLRGPPPTSLYSASPVYSEAVKSWGPRPAAGFAPAAVSGRHRSIMYPEQSMDWDPQLRMQWLKHSLHVHDDDFVSLADALLEYSPEERPTAAQALEHPFFQGMHAL